MQICFCHFRQDGATCNLWSRASLVGIFKSKFDLAIIFWIGVSVDRRERFCSSLQIIFAIVKDFRWTRNNPCPFFIVIVIIHCHISTVEWCHKDLFKSWASLLWCINVQFSTGRFGVHLLHRIFGLPIYGLPFRICHFWAFPPFF